MIPFMAVILYAATYAARLWATTENVIEDSFFEIERPEPVAEVNPIDEPVSFLFLGIDNDEGRDLGSTRADSIIYATLNPNTYEMNMVSIPRDTYVPIYRNGSVVRWDRINAAYAVGEESVMVQTVEEWLDVPVHYYATFNFDAFLGIIDELGGIEMDVPITFTEMDSSDQAGAIHLEEGHQTLNGEEALALARTRKLDDDVARGHRQQLIIQAIIDKALDFGSISAYTDIVETVGANMRTNMRMNDMRAVAQTGLNREFTIESHVFEWSSFMDNQRDLVEIMPHSLEEVKLALQESLELVDESETNALTEDETTPTNNPTSAPSQFESDDESTESW
jgi:LCP family protein required for cell wall assembly